MDANTRACIAYIAGRLVSGKISSSVYNYASGRRIGVSGTIQPSRVNAFDQDELCHVSGNGIDGKYSLYHHTQCHHIELEFNGERFKGYDYGTGSHFHGSVSGCSICLYDFEESSHFNYCV